MQIQCHLCGIKFLYEENLAQHLQNVHHTVFEEQTDPQNDNVNDNIPVKEVSSLTKAEFICVRRLAICFH